MAKKDTPSKKRSKKTDSTEDVIEVKKVEQGSAVAAGRNSKALVINFAQGNPVLIGGFVLIALGVITILSYLLLHNSIPKMTGEFNIAVASFSTNKGKSSNIGDEIATVFSRRLQLELSNYSSQNKAIVFDVLLPKETGTIEGGNPIERANNATKLAKEINADIIIYGTIETKNDGNIIISPEFIVTSHFIKDAEEVLGQYKLGNPITIENANTSLPARLDFNQELADRSSALSFITLGLFNYFTEDYKKALDFYQLADSLENWTGNNGKEVLYILMGNAAIKQLNFHQAQKFYQRAIDINSQYSRGYIGLATVSFRDAISDPSKVDYEGINDSIDFFKKALSVKDSPASSYIDTKAHFGLGEANLLLAQANKSDSLSESEEDFNYVVAEFEKNPDPILFDRAAESYAHLGLIAYIKGYPMSRVEDYYQKAVIIGNKFDTELSSQYLETLAKLYLNQKDTISASRTLKQAINNSNNSDTRKRLESLLVAIESTPTP